MGGIMGGVPIELYKGLARSLVRDGARLSPYLTPYFVNRPLSFAVSRLGTHVLKYFGEGCSSILSALCSWV